jgi:hypothetical protein
MSVPFGKERSLAYSAILSRVDPSKIVNKGVPSRKSAASSKFIAGVYDGGWIT